MGGGGGGGGQAAQGRGKIPRIILPPGDKLPGGVGVGQDKLLHRLKLDTDEETNDLTELSYNKCTCLNYLGYLGHLNDFSCRQ